MILANRVLCYNLFTFMKKQLTWVLFVLLFAVGILFVSIVRLTSHVKPIFAVVTLKAQVSPPAVPTISLPPKIDYILVYPGILPDSPLYKIKAIRDRIWLWLETDSIKKSELLLLYSDKRVGAGKVLIEGNKVDLGITTFWKGEKYLESAVKEVKSAKSKNLSAGLIAGKVKLASLKHEEILLEIKEKVTPEGRAGIEEILKYLKEVQKEASAL